MKVLLHMQMYKQILARHSYAVKPAAKMAKYVKAFVAKFATSCQQ